MWFAALLIVLAAGAYGCSAEYDAEKLYWRAERQALPVSKNPSAASDEQMLAAVKAFESVVQQAAGTVSAAKSQFALGSLYAIRKDYPKAIEAYQLVIRNHSQFQDFLFAARIALANIYRIQQDRHNLIAVYKDISQYHPWSVLGLEVPLILADDAASQAHGDVDAGVTAYQAAAAYYINLFDKAPSEALTLRAKAQLVVVFQRLNKWAEAAALLEELAASKANSVNRPMVMLTLASLYETKLKNPERAWQVYEQLAAEHADLPVGKAAAERLKAMAPSATP